METIINAAKKIIDAQINEPGYLHNLEFNSVSKGYFWSNECISKYLDLVNFEHKENAICVAASGDQVFSLIEKGIKNIDTFDINALTEYFVFGLKKALILKHNYNDYLRVMTILSNFYQNNSVEVETIILEALPYMEDKYKTFWQIIVDYNHQVQKGKKFKFNLMPMLFNCCFPVAFAIQNCPYLQDAVSYNTLKENLKRATITFKNINMLDLAQNYSGQYDFILLSNILDFMFPYWQKWEYQKLANYIEEIEGLLKSNGILFLKYVFEYRMRNNSHLAPLFNDANVVLEDLTDLELYELPAECSYAVLSDAIILKRGKKCQH